MYRLINFLHGFFVWGRHFGYLTEVECEFGHSYGNTYWGKTFLRLLSPAPGDPCRYKKMWKGDTAIFDENQMCTGVIHRVTWDGPYGWTYKCGGRKLAAKQIKEIKENE